MTALFDVVADAHRHVHHHGDKEAFIDPELVMFIVEFINEVIVRFQECREDRNGGEGVDPELVVATAKKPSRIHRWLVRRELLRDLGYREFRRHGRDILETVWEAGKHLNVSHVKAA